MKLLMIIINSKTYKFNIRSVLIILLSFASLIISSCDSDNDSDDDIDISGRWERVYGAGSVLSAITFQSDNILIYEINEWNSEPTPCIELNYEITDLDVLTICQDNDDNHSFHSFPSPFVVMPINDDGCISGVIELSNDKTQLSINYLVDSEEESIEFHFSNSEGYCDSDDSCPFEGSWQITSSDYVLSDICNNNQYNSFIDYYQCADFIIEGNTTTYNQCNCNYIPQEVECSFNTSHSNCYNPAIFSFMNIGEVTIDSGIVTYVFTQYIEDSIITYGLDIDGDYGNGCTVTTTLVFERN